MTTVINDSTWAFWHMPIFHERGDDSPIGDYTVVLQKGANDHYFFEGRLRWYRDDKYFEESNDEKVGVVSKDLGVDRVLAVEQVRIFLETAPGGPHDYDEILREEGKSLDFFIDEMLKRPWAQSKVVSKEEAMKYMGVDGVVH